jgi:hypothetical protein
MKIKELTGRDDTNFQVLDFSTIGSGAPAADVPSKEKKEKPAAGQKMSAEDKKKMKEA